MASVRREFLSGSAWPLSAQPLAESSAWRVAVKAVNLSEKLTSFNDHWAPKIVGQLNDYHLKLAKIKGEFVWHSHPDTDELFLVLNGDMEIEFRDQVIHLSEGEVIIVPKGVEHRPRASDECQIMLIEPAGTTNTGDAGGELTAEDGVWI